MRPEEFKAAGLDKLNEDEMQHLDAYLQGYRQAAKKKANEEAQAKASEEIKKAKEQTKSDVDTGMGGRSRMDASSQPRRWKHRRHQGPHHDPTRRRHRLETGQR